MFLKECTRDQRIIQELLEQNTVLRKALEARGTAKQVAHPKFLQALIDQCVKNSSGKLTYTDPMKDVALYLYILSGPQAYEIWRQNLALPSISTVRRKLGKEEPVREGDIRAEAAKEFLITQDEPLFVFIAEDDTKTTPGVNYNVNDDTVIGLELPLDKNGVPIKSFFKFTSISAVQEYLKTYPISTYAKLVTCTSLKAGSRPFPLLIYGTHGSDRAEAVVLRWNHIYDALGEVGIKVIGFSSDGFAAFLKAMKSLVILPNIASDCPEIFKWFFFAYFYSKFLCIQDAVHMVVKALRALMTKELQIGTKIASRAKLVALTQQLSRMVIGISENQLTDNKDAMNFDIAEKVCSKRVTDRLNRPEELATKSYLLMMRHVIIAYIDPSTQPEERLFSAWYVAFFCRLWKQYLIQTVNQSYQSDALNATIGKNFISSNLHGCIELNGHEITLLCIRCRDMGKPELFQLANTGSQQCESSFRSFRSMSTTKSTVVNFTTKELLQKVKRQNALESIASSTSENFSFLKKKPKEAFIAGSLPQNEEINGVVRRGFEGARIDMSRLREFTIFYPHIHHFVKFPVVTEFNWREDSIPINIARLIPVADIDELRLEESFPAEATDDDVLDADDQEDLDDISRDQAFMCNLSYTTNDGRQSGALQEDLSNNECPKGFLAFKRNNEPVYLRKSSLLWMLTSKNSKISADRLHRFIDEKKIQGDDHVMCGDFVMMGSDDNAPNRLCQVLGFKFLTGNPKFSAMSCPIEVEEEKARGVAVFCAFFRVTNNVVTAMRTVPKYIDMKKFKNHVTITRDLHSDKITLS